MVFDPLGVVTLVCGHNFSLKLNADNDLVYVDLQLVFPAISVVAANPHLVHTV